MSIVRKVLMWWLDWPVNSYVSLSGVTDFTSALAYVDSLNRSPSETDVTIHHLVLAAIARILKAFPQANSRIVGNRIVPQEHVNIAMPVNLLGHRVGVRQEVGMAVLERADKLSLRELARSCQRVVRAERHGHSANPLMRFGSHIADVTPYPLISGMLNLANRVSRLPLLSRKLAQFVPMTTIVSNLGAALGQLDGALFRAASFQMPQRIFHVGTVWGLSALQNEVIAVNGAPQVRPVMPVILVFDHRLFDGVVASRLFLKLVEIFTDPWAEFGPDGLRQEF